MVADEIGICADLRHHALLLAQRATFESVLGLDRSDRCPVASNISR